MKNEDPTTELVKLEANSDMTHALLCAVVSAQGSGGDFDRYEDELEEWEDTIRDAYWRDRRAADSTTDSEG